MGEFPVVFSLSALLIGALWLRRLWLGALLALGVFSGMKAWADAGLASFIFPAADGAVISFELLLLLFGAYLFYRVLQSNDHFDTLNKATASFSSRISVVIILCYFFGSFMEGVAGFGIPAMLIAPMLLSLGFSPLTCIVLPLAANTTAVTFGALGTPLKVGLGIMAPDPVVRLSLVLNAIPALTLPFLLAWLYGRTEQREVEWRKEWRMLLCSGGLFSLLYVVTGLVTIEYASVVAGAVGLLAFVFLFIPRIENPSMMLWVRTFYPYLLLIGLLMAGRHLLSGAALHLMEHSRTLTFYQPGVLFVLATLVYGALVGPRSVNPAVFLRQCGATARAISRPALTILLLVCYTQFIREDFTALAQSMLHGSTEGAMVVFSPLLGMAGSFLTGSATMSNLLFGDTIAQTGFSDGGLFLMMALLHTGSAIGNAVSLQNILMVQSVVNAPGMGYFTVLRWNAAVIVCYLILVLAAALLLHV